MSANSDAATPMDTRNDHMAPASSMSEASPVPVTPSDTLFAYAAVSADYNSIDDEEQTGEAASELRDAARVSIPDIQAEPSKSSPPPDPSTVHPPPTASLGENDEDAFATAVRPSSRARYRFSSVDDVLRSFLELLKPATPVLDSQVYMAVGAITASFLLVAFSIVFRLEIYDMTRINSGLVFGSVGTLVMCSVIIVNFMFRRWYHTRHMHILLFNLACCEFLLALSFILEPAWKHVHAGVGKGLSCTWLSTVREYLIMCSTVWTTCMAVDLYYLMTDPFTSPRHNRRKYRSISNLMATVSAAIMGFFNAFDAPVAVGKFCWVGAKMEAQNDTSLANNISIWLFIIVPVVVSMSITIYVTVASYNRFQEGTAATLQSRQVLVREGFLTTIMFIVYSAMLWGVYAGYWLASTDSTTSEILSVLFTFLLSYRGSVVFILWCLYKKPTKYSTSNRSPSSGRSPQSDDSQIDAESSGEASEEAVRPQMNVALLTELVQFTTQGISRAIRMAPRTSGTMSAATPMPTLPQPKDVGSNAHTFTLRSATSRFSAWNEIKFTDHFPETFARIRASFGIQNEAFLTSLAKCTTPKVSEGASGSFMFYSKDRSFIVKSLSAGESVFLHSILERYVDYMTTHPNTFITRFLGSFCIQLYGKNAYFVVMENVFDVQHGVSIHQRYDIKGSWIDRNAQKPRHGAEITCRHCNLTFRHGIGRNVCPNRAGGHEPNVVLKDMDLTTKLRFGPGEGKRLLRQLKGDSDFLCDLGIMDYSLLLGVIEVSYQVNQQNILTRDGSVFMDQIIPETSDLTAPGVRIKQSAQCLRTSEVVIGPGFYYIGVIDILQTWTWSKWFERFVKSFILRKDPAGISAMPPKPYRARFHKKLDEIIHLGHNVVNTPKNSQRMSENESTWRVTHILRGVLHEPQPPADPHAEVNGDSSVIAGQVRMSQ